MHNFQRRFRITSLAIIRPEHSRTISGPWGYIHRCYQTIFPGAHKVETVLSQVLNLQLSERLEPRPTLGKHFSVETQ